MTALIVASVAAVMVLSVFIEELAVRDTRRRADRRRSEMPAE